MPACLASSQVILLIKNNGKNLPKSGTFVLFLLFGEARKCSTFSVALATKSLVFQRCFEDGTYGMERVKAKSKWWKAQKPKRTFSEACSAPFRGKFGDVGDSFTFHHFDSLCLPQFSDHIKYHCRLHNQYCGQCPRYLKLIFGVFHYETKI